jgi:hypothetical protein
MKRKLAVFLATVVVAIAALALLPVSAATAQTPIVEHEGGNATAIRNLEVDGVLYDVVFLEDQWEDIWEFQTPFDFNTSSTAQAAVEAAAAALNDVPEVVTVGPNMEDTFRIPFNRTSPNFAATWDSIYDIGTVGGEPDVWTTKPSGWFSIERVTYAKFTEVTAPPDEFTIGGSVTGLEGSGLVLQNNGTDDLPVDSDGPFTFATSRTPGSFYYVTVATNPTNPTQTCTVTNGSGEVPTVDVTDVLVSCAEAEQGANFTRAAQNSVLANLYSASVVQYGTLAMNDPANIPLVQLNAQAAYDYAEDAFNDATTALAAAGQDATFWGVYAVQYAEADMKYKAYALFYFDQAVIAYEADDLGTAWTNLDNGLLATSMAIVNNGSTIWTASTESAVATK